MAKPHEPNETEREESSILGLSTRELAGLSVEEITGNATAITMLMHYYKQLVGDNSSLKNEINTLKTYADGYQRKRTFSTVGAVLLTVSNVLVAFGVSLIVSNSLIPGISTLIPGIVLILAGLYFSLRDSS